MYLLKFILEKKENVKQQQHQLDEMFIYLSLTWFLNLHLDSKNILNIYKKIIKKTFNICYKYSKYLTPSSRRLATKTDQMYSNIVKKKFYSVKANV